MARLIETITEYREQPDCRTAAQMELICCEEAPALRCCEVAGPWDGYSADEVFEMLNLNLDNEGRDSEGRYVYIEFVEREGPCGEKVIDYDLTPGNCCDDVEPIEIDRDATPDILPARYSINIYWDGGRHPTTVQTSNGATYFANYKREIVVTGGGYLTLFATEFFCGSTVVSFSDGCTTDSMGIRSDGGYWLLVDQYGGDRNKPFCPAAFAGYEVPAVSQGGGWASPATAISGGWRFVEYHSQSPRINNQGFEYLGEGSCAGGTSQTCFTCVGENSTCPKGRAFRDYVYSTPSYYPSSFGAEACLTYEDIGFSACYNGPCGHSGWYGQFQTFCEKNTIAQYDPTYISSSGGSCSLSLVGVYRWLMQTNAFLYKWTC